MYWNSMALLQRDVVYKDYHYNHYDADRNASQSLSFAKARNRWESPFFFAWSISAYVSP